MSLFNQKYQKIYQLITQWIDSGVLLPEDKLPSIREMAETHKVSKNTVIEAYSRLQQNNVIYARNKSGFYVLSDEKNKHYRKIDTAFQRAYNSISLLTDQLDHPYECKPGDGRYPVAWMDTLAFNEYLGASNHSSEALKNALEYGDPRGHKGLLKLLHSRLCKQFVGLTDKNMMTTAGINHAFDLIIRHYLKRGNSVLVESPGYYPLFSKLEMSEVKMIPWARRSAIDLNHLELILKKHKPSMFFMQPYAHNPTGGSIDQQSVSNICTLCQQYQTQVVIDDPFAALLNNSHHYWGNNVIYLSSFSKTLSTSLRSGYIIADSQCIDSLIKLKLITMVNTSAFSEAIIYDLIRSQRYDNHLVSLAKNLAQSFTESMSNLSELTSIRMADYTPGGLYLWARLPAGISDMQLADMATKEGIFLAPGKLFYPGTAPYPALRLNISYAKDPKLNDFLRRHLSRA